MFMLSLSLGARSALAIDDFRFGDSSLPSLRFEPYLQRYKVIYTSRHGNAKILTKKATRTPTQGFTFPDDDLIMHESNNAVAVFQVKDGKRFQTHVVDRYGTVIATMSRKGALARLTPYKVWSREIFRNDAAEGKPEFIVFAIMLNNGESRLYVYSTKSKHIASRFMSSKEFLVRSRIESNVTLDDEGLHWKPESPVPLPLAVFQSNLKAEKVAGFLEGSASQQNFELFSTSELELSGVDYEHAFAPSSCEQSANSGRAL